MSKKGIDHPAVYFEIFQFAACTN